MNDNLDRICNKCEHYEGVHNVPGHAPCSFKNSGVLWNDSCPHFYPYRTISIKENEVYVEIELFCGKTKIGEAEVDLKNKMLAKLVVYEPYQNQGYGTEIVKTLIEKYNISNLWVKANNKHAIHVYEKCGFKISKPTMYEMIKGDNNE